MLDRGVAINLDATYLDRKERPTPKAKRIGLIPCHDHGHILWTRLRLPLILWQMASLKVVVVAAITLFVVVVRTGTKIVLAQQVKETTTVFINAMNQSVRHLQ